MGKLYAIIGSSGSGKTTVGNYVFGKNRELISTTTRQPRRNEVNGKHYYFILKSQFRYKMDRGEFAEYDFYDGHYYALSREEINSKLDQGDAYVVITYKGYLQLKQIVPEIVSIFIETSKEHAEAMLKCRGDKDIQSRLLMFENEQKLKHKCDYIVYNEFGNLEKTLSDVIKIKNKHEMNNL